MTTRETPMPVGTKVIDIRDGRTGIVTGFMGSDRRYVRWNGGKRDVCMRIEFLDYA